MMSMSFDFQSYLIASSPPDCDFAGPLYGLKRRRSPQIDVNGLDVSGKPTGPTNELWSLQESLVKEEALTREDDRYEGCVLTKCTDRRNDADRIRSWQELYNCGLQTSCCCKTNSKTDHRKVTFADDVGREISEVREIEEFSDDPPILRISQLPYLVEDLRLEDPKLEKQPVSLAINFLQPAADYLAFRNKVSSFNVSLENIIVRDCWQLVGTVKVKNIAQSKAVFIRCTFDSWASCQDFSAHYVDCGRPTSVGQFDTFSFEISVQAMTGPVAEGAIQFAVCYRADGCEYWDNNDQQNYRIDVETIKMTTPLTSNERNNLTLRLGNNGSAFNRNSRRSTPIEVPLRQPAGSWSEFAGWNGVDESSPYW